MLPRKQRCLARNHLGMLCQCQALSGGRCHFHSPLSARVPLSRRVARRLSQHIGPLFASFEVWGDLFGGQYGESSRRPSPPPSRALLPASMRASLAA